MRRDVMSVDADYLAEHAERIAIGCGVHHLLVLENETRLQGIICRCDLWSAPSDSTVGDLMTRHVATIDSRTTLDEALETMNGLAVGCLPVLEGDVVVGTLTRGDLRRAGVLSDQLMTRICASCGSRHHIRFALDTISFCRECLDQGRASDSTDPYEDLGGEQ